MAANKPIFFVSHSSKDKSKVDIVRDAIGMFIELEDYEIIYTSHPEGSLLPGEDIPESTVGRVEDASIFLAYISQNYIASTLCIAEFGVAYVKNMKAARGYAYLLVKDKYLAFTETTPLGLNKVTMDCQMPSTIVDKLKLQFEVEHHEKEKQILDEIETRYAKEYYGYDHKFELALSAVDSFIKKIFKDTSLLFNAPLILYLTGKMYKGLSESLIGCGDEHLLWTLSSPLRNKLYDKRTGLTAYDLVFKNGKSNDKVRLIIFTSKSEESEYFNTRDSKLLKRKLKFEQANEKLYYLSVSRLITEFNTRNEKKQIKISAENRKKLFVEFGYSQSKDGYELCFFSEIATTDQSKNYDSIDWPIVFVNPKNVEDPKYTNHLLNKSVLLNNFIIAEFSSLENKRIIKKIC